MTSRAGLHRPVLPPALLSSSLFSCALLAFVAACQRDLSNEELIEMSHVAERAPPPVVNAQHGGPPVATGAHGTGRFADKVFAAFSADNALATTTFADRWYREPGNDGFEAVIDEIVRELREAGYGQSEHLLLEVLSTPMKSPAWTPKSARLSLVHGDTERVLHAFSAPEDRDRTMLPRNAPSADVEGRLVTTLEAVEQGCVLLTEESLGRVLEDAKARGAVLVLSSALGSYNVDPKPGGERHLDAIGYRSVRHPAALPVAQVSPRTAKALRDALAQVSSVRVKLECETTFAERPLRTVVATVVGATKPDECVAIAAHVQEPGACDNASGVGTMVEAARTAAKLLSTGELTQPARSVCFVFGDEMAQSRIFLDDLARKNKRCFAGIAADMTGESAEQTGAIALIERPQDPGALKAHPPDRHTAWSGGNGTQIDPADIVPSGIALVARCALLDVGALQSSWKTDEHPFEGGSDHVVFLDRKIPAVLFWHFTDFTYHTSLDRLECVDADEMRRTGSAILSTALAIADPQPTDLERYLKSLRLESEVRARACQLAGDEETAEAWRKWTVGARMWLRELCLTTAPPAAATIEAHGKPDETNADQKEPR